MGPKGGIYFLAEAPGRDEDERSGTPLTGPSGSLLRECIPEGSEDICSFDNVINCRPPKNRTPEWQEIECFGGDTRMAPVGRIKALYRRRYRGATVKLVTSKGHILTGTPNHPVFTSEGLTPLKYIKVGDYLYSTALTDVISPTGKPDRQNIPSTISEVFDSFSKVFELERVNGSSLNFHGDGTSNSYVDIVRTDGKLLRNGDLKGIELCQQGQLPVAHSTFSALVNKCAFDPNFLIPTVITPFTGSLLPIDLIPQTVGIRSSTNFDPPSNKCLPDGVLRQAGPDSKLNHRHTQSIVLDEVVLVEICESFDGHVYNLETESNSYIADNVLVSNCCRPRRWKWIEQAKPKLIVGLGAVPLHAILGSTDLSGMRGRLFAVQVGNHSCWFLPTYHPSFILRTAYDKKKPLNSRLGHCLRMDIDRAFSHLPHLAYPSIDSVSDITAGIHTLDGNAPTHFDELLGLLAKAKEAPVKSVDLETKGLRPYSTGAAVMSCAFSFGSINFSFALDHPQAKWTPTQRVSVKQKLRAIIKDDTIKIAHNVPFELEWFIWMFGPEVVNHAAWEDTMMQAHFLDERRGKKGHGDDDRRAPYQGLDFLCKMNLGVTYKKLFKLNKKDMSKSPLGDVLTYNGVDTKYTLRLFHHQDRLLKRQDLHAAYLDALPRQPTIALMQWLGMPVDQRERKRCQDQLGPEIKAIEAEIFSLKVVKAYITDNKEFNPFSDKDAVRIFKDYLKRPEVTIQDEKGTRYSTNKNILDTIDHPLANLIIRLRNRNKLKSTYVDSLELGVGEAIYPDGMIHTNFNTTFAETGRTSSDEPNMQNFPKRNDAWVRKQIVAPPKHILLAFDYGQLEACTAAMESKDKVLVKALWEDYDIHMEWAQRVATAYPAIVGGKAMLKDPKVMGKFRSRIKNKFVFPAIFGAHPLSIAGYLSMPEDIIDDQVSDFWEQFHGLKKWQDNTMKEYYKNGYVTTYVGRRHRYPLSSNQAINHPIQGLACEIVCDAMTRLSFESVSTGNWHIHPRLNIHDDLTFVVPDNDDEIESAVGTIYKAMLTPPYKCVNVPLSVKASVGTNWLDMEEIGQFWSHHDL